MRVPMSWLREYAGLPADLSAQHVAGQLTRLGLKLEALETPGSDVSGPLVVGRVEAFEPETHSNGKTIRWCQVDVGEAEPRGIVCGADNFAVGDLVVVALPDTVLPGGFEISARKTYGHVSDGMICSARELRLGEDHTGIMVLEPGEAQPGDDAADVLYLRDEVVELEITPDRAYALSMRGVAREAAAANGLAFEDPAQTLPAVADSGGYPVRVDDPTGAPVFALVEVTGFDPSAPTPRWLARRVQLAGMRPISLAVDVTNYVMWELGNPIHGYDRDRLQGRLGVRRARDGETLQTLDGVQRTLDPEDLVITDDRGPVGLAGVMGGAAVEMGDATTNVVIEAAHFDPVSVARSARRHKLPSEAARRFERGTDPALPHVAARRVADLLVRYGGGEVSDAATVVGSPPEAAPITMTVQRPTAVAGFPIAADEVRRALRVIGCTPGDDGTSDPLSVVPPSWRPDLTDPNDLCEEVLRIVGYDQIPSVLPIAPAGRGLTARQRLLRRVGRVAAGNGYVEVLSYPFIGAADFDALGLPPEDERRTAVAVANPLSERDPLLRTTILPGLLHALGRNVSRGIDSPALFETGSVFGPATEAGSAPDLGVDRAPTAAEIEALERTLPQQPLRLGVALCGDREQAGWWGPPRPVEWADTVQFCRDIANSLGLQVRARPAQVAPWHPGRCAEILLDGRSVGYAGELHPKVCRAYGLPPRAGAAELDLEPLLRQAREIVRGPDFSHYPVAKEDLALVVDDHVPAADVAAALRGGAGDLLESLRLFDLYSGEQVPAGKKSLAFALRFRAPDRTLTDEEIKAARTAAVTAVEEQFGASLRR